MREVDRIQLHYLACLFAVFALVGCQSDERLTLAEAKKVTANFATPVLVAPPRKIDDILRVLETQRDADVRLLSKLKKHADRPIAGFASPGHLAALYQARAASARALGRANQEIADLTQAATYYRKAGETQKATSVSFTLGLTEVRAGNFEQGLKRINRVVERWDRIEQGTGNLRSRPELMGIFAQSGDFSKADALLDETEEVLPSIDEISDFTELERISIFVALTQGKADLLTWKGQLQEAENSYRNAIRRWLGAKNIVGQEQSADRLPTNGRWDRILNLLITRLADNLRKQGRFVESEIEARKALQGTLRSNGKYSSETASVLRTLTLSVYEQGRYREAEALSRQNLEIFERAGVSPATINYGLTRLLHGDALIAQNKWGQAKLEFSKLEAEFSSNPKALNRLLTGNLSWAAVLLRDKKPLEARKFLAEALRVSTRILGEVDVATNEIRGFLAETYVGTSEQNKALELYRRSVPRLINDYLERRASRSGSSLHDGRFVRIVEAYIDLLFDFWKTRSPGPGRFEFANEAFELADILRGQKVQQALAASSSRAAAQNSILANLVRRTQDTKAQITSTELLITSLMASSANKIVAKNIDAQHSRLRILRQARFALLAEVTDKFPEYAALVNPRPIKFIDVQKLLQPNEALISIFVGQNRTYVWAVPKSGSMAFWGAELGKADLTRAVRNLRVSLAPNVQTLGDIPAFDLGESHELYRQLLEPVKSGWNSASNILLAKHGPLGQLPFSLLVTSPPQRRIKSDHLFASYKRIPWLIRSHSVTVLPSVSSLASLRKTRASRHKQRPFVGFADPYFTPPQSTDASGAPTPRPTAIVSRGVKNLGRLPLVLRASPTTDQLSSAELAKLPRLPDTADEIKSIARAMNADLNHDVFTGYRATEERVKSIDLTRYKIVAFATHGLVAGDLDGLSQPALALSAPSVSGSVDDGLLTMGEVLNLKLNADWVVLSACNTGAADGAGAEAFSGLGRAFFFAGTRAVLLSNWPVETSSAKLLTTELFKSQAENKTLSRAQALRHTMLKLIDGPGYVNSAGQTVFFYAHPIFWAPLSLVGDGGGGKPTS